MLLLKPCCVKPSEFHLKFRGIRRNLFATGPCSVYGRLVTMVGKGEQLSRDLQRPGKFAQSIVCPTRFSKSLAAVGSYALCSCRSWDQKLLAGSFLPSESSAETQESKSIVRSMQKHSRAEG